MERNASTPSILRCSNARIHLLSDGTSYWDGGGTFGLVPRVKWMKLLPPDEFNRVPQALRCVLIEADGQRILVDCGVGNKPNEMIATQYDVRRPNGTLMDDLARHDVKSVDIDIVIFTHLHGDHSGWATVLRSGGESTPALLPAFPNARYYVQRQEYEDATHPNERTRNTYFAENFVPLMEHGVLTLLDGETRITPSVRVVPTPGHTAGHQSVIVEPRRAGEIAPPHFCTPSPVLLIGDMAPYMIHFERLPWVTAYDVLPMITIESKRTWQQWAFDNDAMLVSCHDTQMPVGRLVRNDKGLFSITPL